MNNIANCTSFLEFLSLLAEDKLISEFTEELIQKPSVEDSYYYSMGGRWCSVQDILKQHDGYSALMYQFAFDGIDADFAFSIGNLKTSYLPDEDFINGGSATVIFSFVGGGIGYIP